MRKCLTTFSVLSCLTSVILNDFILELRNILILCVAGDESRPRAAVLQIGENWKRLFWRGLQRVGFVSLVC